MIGQSSSDRREHPPYSRKISEALASWNGASITIFGTTSAYFRGLACPQGRRLPTSSTARQSSCIKSGKVKTISPTPAPAYSAPVTVQETVQETGATVEPYVLSRAQHYTRWFKGFGVQNSSSSKVDSRRRRGKFNGMQNDRVHGSGSVAAARFGCGF